MPPSAAGALPSEPEPLVFGGPVTLAGGGAMRRKTLERARALAPDTVAVDSGADRLRSWGLDAVAIVGDLDSIENLAHWRTGGCRILHLPEQNSTDLEKCLRMVHAPLLLAVGFLGSRLDHSFAAFAMLAANPDRPIVLMGGSDIVFAPPMDWTAVLESGTRLSILAMRKVRVTAAQGLRWPPTGLAFAPGSARGLSNAVIDPVVRLRFDRPGAMLVLDREALPGVVQSLRNG